MMGGKIFSKCYAWRIPLICGLLSLLGLQQRFVSLAGRELWGDELYQLSLIQGPFKPFWLHNAYGDFSCFPGDYLISWPFVAWFGNNKWGIMIPHILVAIIGFVFLYFLCRRYFRTAFAFFITFAVVAMNQSLVYHAFEFRPYGVLPVLALGGFLCLDLLFTGFRRMSIWVRGLVALFLVYFVSFHIYSFVILTLLLIFQLLSRRNDPRSEPVSGAFLIYLLVVFGSLIGIWFWYAAPNLGIFGFERSVFEQTRPVFEYLPNPVADLSGFLKEIFGNMIGFSKLKWTAIGLLALFVPWNDQRRKQAGFLLLVVVLGLQFVLLTTLFKQYWFLLRQITWVMPLAAFLLGWLWDSLLSWKGNKKA